MQTLQKRPELDFIDEEMKEVRESGREDVGKMLIADLPFKEAQLILREQINKRLSKRKIFNKHWKSIMRRANKNFVPNTAQHYFYLMMMWVCTHAQNDFTNELQLVELKKYWKFNQKKRTNRKTVYDNDRFNFEEKLNHARSVPIEEIYENDLKHSGNRLFGLCPIHDERSPSFCIYADQNTFHCFGCGAHGDGISLYQKIHNVDFKEAVSALSF